MVFGWCLLSPQTRWKVCDLRCWLSIFPQLDGDGPSVTVNAKDVIGLVIVRKEDTLFSELREFILMCM